MSGTDTTDASLRRNWFHVLLVLSRGDLHGYAVMKEVEEHTRGELRLWPATLYGTLRDLCEAGFTEEVQGEDPTPAAGRRRRTYRITAAGRMALAGEADRLAEFVELARARRAR